MNKYDINDKVNYFKTFNCTIELAFNKYCTLIEEFINSIIKIQRYDYYKYILIKGIENIYHIFNILLLNSKNIDFTYHHTQRGYLYYYEFIEQIKNDNNIVLNLNIKDATLFIYKKVLLGINNNNNNIMSSIEKNNLLILDKIITFYNSLLYNLIILQDFNTIETLNKNIVKHIFKYSFNDIVNNIDVIKKCNDVIFIKITSIDKIIQLCKLINKYIKTHEINVINIIDTKDINTITNNKIIKKIFKF